MALLLGVLRVISSAGLPFHVFETFSLTASVSGVVGEGFISMTSPEKIAVELAYASLTCAFKGLRLLRQEQAKELSATAVSRKSRASEINVILFIGNPSARYRRQYRPIGSYPFSVKTKRYSALQATRVICSHRVEF
jgi:hypothetical protein